MSRRAQSAKLFLARYMNWSENNFTHHVIP